MRITPIIRYSQHQQDPEIRTASSVHNNINNGLLNQEKKFFFNYA